MDSKKEKYKLLKMNSQLSRGMHTQKNFEKSEREKNHMEVQNWFMKTILQLKSLEKTENALGWSVSET